MNIIHIYNKKQEDSRESKESSVEKTRVSVKNETDKKTGDSCPVVAVVRVVDNHGDQPPDNNVTTSERELCGDGSPQYVFKCIIICMIILTGT
jgi:hypothetical protein